MIYVDLDKVDVGTLVYDPPGTPLGWVEVIEAADGDPMRAERCIDTGKREPKYVKVNRYRRAKESGGVWIKSRGEAE